MSSSALVLKQVNKIDKPTRPKKVACTLCHKNKSGCVFSQADQTKCDRCLRLNRVCVPHISRQGQRKKKDAKATAEPPLRAPIAPAATFANGAISGAGKEGDNTSKNQTLNAASVTGVTGCSSPQCPKIANSSAAILSPSHTSLGTFPSGTFPAAAVQVVGGWPADSSMQLQNIVANSSAANCRLASPSHTGLGTSPPSTSPAAGLRGMKDGPGHYQQVNVLQQTHYSYSPCLGNQVGVASGKDFQLQNNCGSDIMLDSSTTPYLANNTQDAFCASVSNEVIQYSLNEFVSNTEEIPTSIVIPLREWIKGAAFNTNIIENQGATPISPDYITSCLRIAVSLSRQISDAEEFSQEKLRWLPMATLDWAGCIKVKLVENGTGDTAHYEHFRIDSAEIFTIDPNKHGNHDVHLSFDHTQRRIHNLGLVFLELFSGGKLPPPPLSSSPFSDHITLPNVWLSDDQLEEASNDGKRPTGSRMLNLSNTLKLGNEEEVEDRINPNHARGRKKLASRTSSNSTAHSLEQIGLPRPLCDLVLNMIDCGDLSGEESYTKIADVAFDLQQMTDKPSIFLHGPDVALISAKGLHLKDELFMRSRELSSLQQAYQRSTSGSSEAAVISGLSGTGKSALALRLGSHIASNNGLFLSVKFDQLKQAHPFSALICAFNEYCKVFTESKASTWVKAMANKLRDVLGQDVYQLIKVMPRLSDILDCNTTGDASIQECANELNKVHYLLTRFVEIMSSFSEVKVTLCLDDAHWADAFSLSVLRQIMMIPEENNRLFVVICFRNDEVDEQHPFKSILDSFSGFGVRLTEIHLDCLDKDAVNRFVSESLCMSQRLVKSLSDILYHKTMGNPLFLRQLLVSLNRESLLRLSLTHHKWVWDEEQIMSRELPNDVVTLILVNFSRLPTEVKKAIQHLACFGCTASCKMISLLETKLNLKLTEPLEIAIGEGLLHKRKGNYCFAHDQFQQSAYSSIQQEERLCMHSNNGIRLVKVAMETNDDSILMIAVSQLNLVSPSLVTDVNHSLKIAQYNLLAGKKALPDFNQARDFFKHGILHLKGNHWRTKYKLSLQLFQLLAKCSLVLGDFETLTASSTQVQTHAICLEDKIDTLYYVMTSLAYARKISDSVAIGLSILTQLGHELPTFFTQVNIASLAKQTQNVLVAISDDDLMNHKRLFGQKDIMAMKVLAGLHLATFHVKPDIQPLVTLKMVNMSIDKGMCHASSVGFAYYASLMGKLGEMRDAYRFAKLAKKMLGADNSKEVAGSVVCIVSETLSFYEPMQSVNEYRIQGQHTALAAGDVNFACALKLLSCVASFYGGSNLATVKNDIEIASRYTKAQNHLSSYFVLKLMNSSISSIMGCELEDEDLTEAQLTNPNQLLVFYFQKLLLSFLLNNYDDMKLYAEKFFQYRTTPWVLFSTFVNYEFYGGLASFRVYRETGDQRWLERGMQCKSEIKLWSEQGSLWNFEHKLHLMEAEFAYCCNDLLNAQLSYGNAIVKANSRKFIHDEALAYELAGYFQLNVGMMLPSFEHLKSAHEKYHQWGARRKARDVFNFCTGTYAAFDEGAFRVC